MIEKFKQNPIRFLLYYVSFSLLILSLIIDNPITAFKNLQTILITPDGLITDYISVGGYSGAFLNSSLVSLLSLFIFDVLKLKYNGTSIATFFLMTGFSLFGKNILNILPILLGVYLFALYKKESFKRYIYIAFFGTSFSPVVSEIAIHFDGGFTPSSITLGVLAGVLAGFLLPPISIDCLRVLHGYNLYNTGFASGLIGLLFASLLLSFGYNNTIKMIWTLGIDPYITIFFILLFLSFILLGFILNDKSFKGYFNILKHSGRAVADFTAMEGLPLTFINMGIVGIFAILYIFVIGGDINGPTLGAVLTIVGFGALGKHLKNMTPPMAGVIIMSLIAHWDLRDPSIQLATLFCTGLAPIAGTFGFFWGIIAGAIHSVIVICVTSLHGGLNLYNNGFAAGLVVLILNPIIEALRKDDDD